VGPAHAPSVASLPRPRGEQRPDLRVLASPAFHHRLANPYTWLLYTHMVAAGGVVVKDYSHRRLLRRRYDLVHVHWPEGHLNDGNSVRALRRVVSALGMLRWARSRGAKIVWTVHNLHSHERLYPTLERWFWRAFIPRLDGYISLSHSGQEAVLARFPELRRIPGFVIPAGHYRDAYSLDLPKAAARDKLAIDARSNVVSFVGLVRRYKNVPQLIGSFRALADRALTLLVAGEPKSDDVAADVRAAAGDDPRVRLHLGWIPNEQILLYLAAADLVVLPFSEVLNSGSALLALSFDRPVLVPRMGSLAELQEMVGAGWVRTYQGELTPACLASAIAWAVGTPRPPRPPLEALAWDRIAAATREAYASVVTGVGR